MDETDHVLYILGLVLLSIDAVMFIYIVCVIASYM
ncbi:putative membrane protein (plasmid) [Bacillus thuringiensis HD1002]|nr:putative membrane protein [Bacillus thuringiensis HD1002]RCX38692.1 hypothetical protein DEU45_106202 [Bacillus sp. AG102]TWE69597.1 hypothetical protein FHW38_107208 [Bacillus thuringiensis]